MYFKYKIVLYIYNIISITLVALFLLSAWIWTLQSRVLNVERIRLDRLIPEMFQMFRLSRSEAFRSDWRTDSKESFQ